MASWDYANMSSRHPEEWHANSHFNMTNAVRSHKESLKQCKSSVKAHKDCLSENIAQYSSLHRTLETKVNASRSLLEMLRRRIISAQKSIENNRSSFQQLEEADRAKHAPLEQVLWRMQHRCKRPERELIRDGLEQSLEHEKSTLENAQAVMRDRKKRTQASIQHLTASLQELQHDVEEKEQALRIDEMCLRTQHKAWQHSVDVTLTKASLQGCTARVGPMTSREFADDNHTNESSRHTNAQRLNQSACAQEQAAQLLREESSRCIEKCAQMSAQALARTQRSLEDRIQENQEMRRRLEAQIRQTDNKMNKTLAITTETRSQIKSLEEPLRLTEQRDNWRKQRALREQITDPVTTQLVEHKASLMKTNDMLRNRRENEKFVLSDLKRNKERLKEDLREKTSALHIDLDCMVHDVIFQGDRMVQTLSAPKVQRAMRVDPAFAPVPACMGAVRMPAVSHGSGSKTARF